VLKKLLVTVHIANLTLFIDFFGTTFSISGGAWRRPLHAVVRPLAAEAA